MTLFRKPLVCYLGSTFLEIFEANSNNQQRLSFSSESIQHSEVVDEKKFKEELQKFIEELKLKEGKGIILLSAELVYANDINISGKNEKDETEKFLTAVPLLRSNISTISLHNKNKLRIIAVNRKLYEEVLEVLNMYDIEISSVVPVSVFSGRTDDQEFTIQDAKKITKEKRILQRYNFLQSEDSPQVEKELTNEIEDPEEETEKKSMLKQYIFLAISLILLASAVGYLLLWTQTITNPFSKTPGAQPTPKSVKVIVPSVTSHPNPTLSPLTDKATVKIEILNGSGIEGQAGKLGDLLKGIGYSNVTTGNTDNSGQRTTIIYSKLIPKDMLTEITDKIKNDFPDPTIQEASKSAEYDILITTGNF